MLESTITVKGQTTVPSEVRELIHAGPGTRLVWTVAPDGTVIVRAKNRSILELEGSLLATEKAPVPVADMSPWR
jgi:antitoxin PrlF